MHALTLDYCEPLARKYIAWIILGCASLLTVLVFKIHASLIQEHGRWEKEKSQLLENQRHAQANSAGNDLSNATPELTRLGEVKRQLAVPWNSLFSTLEVLSFNGVALLSMQPDTTTQSLTLTAEAKDLSSMMEYARRLAREPMFANVQLTSHQIQQQDPQKPIRFTVQTTWKAQ